MLYPLSNNGSTSQQFSSSNQFGNQQFSAEKQSLLDQLHTARLNNDLVTAERLRKRLDEIDGVHPYPPPVNDPNIDGVKERYVQMDSKPPFIPETDYYVTTISTAGCWAVATASSNRSSAIFAATTEYVNGGGDMIKVYVSYNGGSSWVLKNTYNGFVASVDCRPGELDIEPIISGTDTLVYCTFGYTYNGHSFSGIFRANIGTGTGIESYFSFGGAGSTNVNYYNPKVTSDNTNYTSASYVYITASFDSAGSSRFTSRFAVITNPFTSSTLTFKQPNAPNGFYWNSNGSPVQYLYTDICYFNNSGDKIYTVYNHAGTAQGKNIYIAWSNDYGSTVPAGNTFVLNETADVLAAICASNGGSSVGKMVIGYRRLYSGADWDFRYQYSSTGGVSSSFTPQYIDFTSDTTLLISLQGIDLGNGRFVAGYSNHGGQHYYRSFNGTSLGTNFQSNNVAGDEGFGGCRAGYWNSAFSDSSLVVWSHAGGSGAYCSRQIQGTVGIQPEPNTIPTEFSLKQNYPNPFNPVTNIKFGIPSASFVKLVVYDITGREVAMLVNKQMNAGNYTVDFDASQFASGLYFYRIDANGFTDVKKMILIK
ncbi:MAG: T9SS type A sorting domain-containing protein [Ignavibacteria bacterium]|nr:T9SS type A sorting domain-containing protein [Ignavibacteria bacterium]